jgi:hypothetical protein
MFGATAGNTLQTSHTLHLPPLGKAHAQGSAEDEPPQGVCHQSNQSLPPGCEDTRARDKHSVLWCVFMDKERSSLWHQHWAEAKKAKEDRRRQNREGWAVSPHNSHNRHKQDAVVLGLSLDEEAAAGGGSASLRKMRAIMADTNAQLYRRLDAAEIVLSYELSPGAAVGADPNTIAAASYHFLKAVADDPQVPEALKFRALKSIVAIENQRVQVKNSAAEYDTKKRLSIALCNAERGRALRAAGVWRQVIERNEPWFLEAGDDLAAPPGWFDGGWHWPTSSFAAQLEHADPERIAAFKQELLNIRATNRVDRFDEILARVPEKA